MGKSSARLLFFHPFFLLERCRLARHAANCSFHCSQRHSALSAHATLIESDSAECVAPCHLRPLKAESQETTIKTRSESSRVSSPVGETLKELSCNCRAISFAEVSLSDFQRQAWPVKVRMLGFCCHFVHKHLQLIDWTLDSL